MSRRNQLARLQKAAPVVLPSLLLCDFGNLDREIRRLMEAGVEGLHLDVMDGHFVPNLTYGLPIVEACRRISDLPLDVHLMISRPERYVEAFVRAGADLLTIHVEATDQPRSVLEQIRRCGAAAGLALNPETPLSAIESCLDAVDLLLVMSVPAGFGGQPFHEIALEKLSALRSRVGSEVLLEVDGGVNLSTIERCAESGARLFVVGSAIFQSGDYGRAVRELSHLATCSERRG